MESGALMAPLSHAIMLRVAWLQTCRCPYMGVPPNEGLQSIQMDDLGVPPPCSKNRITQRLRSSTMCFVFGSTPFEPEAEPDQKNQCSTRP